MNMRRVAQRYNNLYRGANIYDTSIQTHINIYIYTSCAIKVLYTTYYTTTKSSEKGIEVQFETSPGSRHFLARPYPR